MSLVGGLLDTAQVVAGWADGLGLAGVMTFIAPASVFLAAGLGAVLAALSWRRARAARALSP